ncbi:MAG: hypothetical protein ABL892_00695 [Thiobacillaceae bacterium]
MLRKTLFAACLLIASGSAMADRDGYVYGRVLTVEPSFSISIGGGRYNDGFRIQYETGGQRYWTHSDYRPRDVIYVPRPVYVRPVYYSNGYRGGDWHHRGWRDRDDHRDGWRGHGDGDGRDQGRGHDHD